MPTFRIYDGGTYFPENLTAYSQVVFRGTGLWQFRDPATGYILTVAGDGFATAGGIAEFFANAASNSRVTSLSVSIGQVLFNQNELVWTATDFSMDTSVSEVFVDYGNSFESLYSASSDADLTTFRPYGVVGPIVLSEFFDGGGFIDDLVLDFSFADLTTDLRNGGVRFNTPPVSPSPSNSLIWSVTSLFSWVMFPT